MFSFQQKKFLGAKKKVGVYYHYSLKGMHVLDSVQLQIFSGCSQIHRGQCWFTLLPRGFKVSLSAEWSKRIHVPLNVTFRLTFQSWISCHHLRNVTIACLFFHNFGDALKRFLDVVHYGCDVAVYMVVLRMSDVLFCVPFIIMQSAFQRNALKR